MKIIGESYQHAAARGVLACWLRQWAREGEFVSAFGGVVSWRVNRGLPTMGVYEEYPLATTAEDTEVLNNWDERLYSTYDWGDGKGDIPNSDADPDMEMPPTVEWLWTRAYTVHAVLDVAISHKGYIVYGFEVVHKHGLTPVKRNYLRQVDHNNLTVFVVPAQWILGQIDRPSKLVFDEAINYEPVVYRPRPQPVKTKTLADWGDEVAPPKGPPRAPLPSGVLPEGGLAKLLRSWDDE